jgi:hypothetical protein
MLKIETLQALMRHQVKPNLIHLVEVCTTLEKIVATQFLTHVLINFQKNPKIAKNIENPKKYIFNTFASFLAFLASSQKNLNFQRHLKHVQLLTRYF